MHLLSIYKFRLTRDPARLSMFSEASHQAVLDYLKPANALREVAASEVAGHQAAVVLSPLVGQAVVARNLSYLLSIGQIALLEVRWCAQLIHEDGLVSGLCEYSRWQPLLEIEKLEQLRLSRPNEDEHGMIENEEQQA